MTGMCSSIPVPRGCPPEGLCPNPHQRPFWGHSSLYFFRFSSSVLCLCPFPLPCSPTPGDFEAAVVLLSELIPCVGEMLTSAVP